MKSLSSIGLFILSLAGLTTASMYCCRPGCGVCGNQQCALINVCTDLIFNTCCADMKDAIMFESADEYLTAVAAGDIDWED